jgi:MFS family permease
MDRNMTPKQRRALWNVIGASSAGTLIEWYDFFIFGALATIISNQFFPKENETVAFLSTLAVFATGFIIRPLGAVVFGWIGDVVGRKYSFLLTLLLMGGSTFAIGLLPTYESWGVWATVLLVLLRLIQGLAIGGEYGGAAIYVAEHAPDGKRGFYTSFIQTTASIGLFASLGVIMVTRNQIGEAAFNDWGWRIPFLLSVVLVLLSYYIRIRMSESPLFAKAKSEGRLSKNPIRESFVQPENRRLVIISLFGAIMGQGVIWYTGQFYAMFFMQKVAGIDFGTTNVILAIALAIGTPFYVFFGSLSDRVGRKPIILGGCLIAGLLYLPMYQGMMHFANPLNVPMLVALVFTQIVLATMVYGPMAAFLVELFPTRIRYTSMSLPYHIGNGVFGGLVPFISSALVAKTGNIYAGIVYPITIALLTAIIGFFCLRETREGTFAE